VIEPTPLKNMLVKLEIFPRDRGENKKYLSCHHLDILGVLKNFYSFPCFFELKGGTQHHPGTKIHPEKNLLKLP